MTFYGWNWKEDGAKFLKAAIGGALVVLIPELTKGDFHVDRVLLGLVLGGALRGILALFEPTSIPAHEVAQLAPSATEESTVKLMDAKAAEKK